MQRSECRLCRHAAVACRSLAGETWERRAVCSLLLLFVQKLQLVSTISHELARWVWWCLQLLLPPLLLPDSSLFTGPVGLSASCRFDIFSGFYTVFQTFSTTTTTPIRESIAVSERSSSNRRRVGLQWWVDGRIELVQLAGMRDLADGLTDKEQR